MSYCRFSDSDIYLYPSDDGIVCQVCSLAPMVNTVFTAGNEKLKIKPCECMGKGCKKCQMHGSTIMKTPEEALEHVIAHRKAGDFVPGYVDERLNYEIKQAESESAES